MGYYSYDTDEIEQEVVEQLASQVDADALNVIGFERDLEEMFQEVPDLHNALISYQEARTKILERKKSRGFWPSAGKGKTKGFGKFQPRKGSGKGNLLQRISRTFCKICGEKGHWKAECPNKPTSSTDTANYVVHQNFHVVDHGEVPEQVIFEEMNEAGLREQNKSNQIEMNGVNNNGVIGQIMGKITSKIASAAKGCIRVWSVLSSHSRVKVSSRDPEPHNPTPEVAYS